MNLQALMGSSPRKEQTQSIQVQIGNLTPGSTSANKPFLDVVIADHSMSVKVKVWGDHPSFKSVSDLGTGACAELVAGFSINDFGLNLANPSFRLLTDDERAAFMAGSPEARAEMERDWSEITATIDAMTLAPIKKLCQAMFGKPAFETRFRRSAGAMRNHHARRGGLLSHTASMLRVAKALVGLYPNVTPDILFAGVLSHDLGKAWENDCGEGFSALFSLPGEMLGHIGVGIEYVNSCWKEAAAADPETFKGTDTLRLHVLHLISSHHGTKEWGSPTTPKTPEAFLLHHIDNLDASMEMLRISYIENKVVCDGMVDSRYPLRGTLAVPYATTVDSTRTF